MIPTLTYTRLHAAFALAAAEHDLRPFAVRVLVAIDDDDPLPAPTPNRIAAALLADASAVRRSLIEELYPGGLVTGVGIDGGPRRRSVNTGLSLTEKGRAVVQTARQAVDRPAVAA